MDKGISSKTEMFLPSIATGFIFVVILAINGLWPFGSNTIDHYDMAQQAEAFYYHNYDQLRGLKSVIFDWYTCLGRPIPGISEPTIFDFFLLFTPRGSIMEFMSVLMLIKIMVASFTMNLFVKDVNEQLPYLYRLMISAGYGLCGYVLMNYTIPQWIDMVAIVPLLLMFSQRALKKGEIVGLTVSVFLVMILDYYFGIQTLEFVFLTGGAYLIYLRSGEKHGLRVEQSHVFRLALGIVLGLGASSFSWLPDIAFGLTSARLSGGSESGLLGSYLELLTSIEPAYLSRWFSLLCISFPAALVAIGLYNGIKERNVGAVVLRLCLVFFAVAQLFFESIHLILHFGSYVNYPVRNGFMIYCIVAGIAARSYNMERRAIVTKISLFGLIVGVLFTGLLVAVFRIWYVRNTGVSDHTILLVTMGFMAVCALTHFFLIKSGKNYGIYIWMAELLIFGIIMIGKPLYNSAYGNDPEQEGEFIRISEQLVKGFGTKLVSGDDAAFRRIKNPDTSLNTNYGMIIRRETLSGWSSMASADQINGATELGYSSQFTRLLDSGGNIFSDTMLHITDAISYEQLNNKLYQRVATTNVIIDHATNEKDDYYLYKNRFEMPFAIPVKDVSKLNATFDNEVNVINAYASSFGSDSDVASFIRTQPETITEVDHEIADYKIRVDGEKILYYVGKCVDTDYYNTIISVNGSIIKIPSIKENHNDAFPAHFNNNTVELGSFRDEDVEVVIDMDVSDPSQHYENYFFEIDLDAFSQLCEKLKTTEKVVQGRRSIDIEFENELPGSEGVLIPVSYDKGWSASVDGNKVEVRNINGLFMYVPLGDGSRIHMSYFPSMMGVGIVIAAFSVICIFVFAVRSRNRDVAVRLDRILIIAYIVFTVMFVCVVYIIPILYAIKSLIF